MMLLTKLEVHKVLHFCLRKTEPWSLITSTENFMKFGHGFSDVQMDRHTH